VSIETRGVIRENFGPVNMEVPSCVGSSCSISLETTRAIAIQALALTVQDWNTMGQSSDPTVSEASLFTGDDSDDDIALDVCVSRVTSLIVIRLVAIRLHQEEFTNMDFDLPSPKPSLDISTSSICRQALIADELPWPFITEKILVELRLYVHTILQNYSPILPFHNRQHSVTVVVNCNKLMDMIVANDYYNDVVQYDIDGRRPPTFGLRNDPTLLLALVFAAFIHDVQHEGVLNSQLVLRNHPSALLYNDQSVQEKRSLQFAFETLLDPNYASLRDCLFVDDTKYRYFRTAVISAVMSTDLASPEQMVLMKSKWKEAFYRPQVAEEPMASNSPSPVNKPGRRSSTLSNISMPRYTAPGASNFVIRSHTGNGFNRRGSNYSEMSEITTDIGVDYRYSLSSPHRRFSADMEYNASNTHPSSSYIQPQLLPPRRRTLPPRRCSNASETSSDGAESNELAADSVALMYQRKNRARADEVSVDSVVSDTVDSYVLHAKKPMSATNITDKSSETGTTDKEPVKCDVTNGSNKDGESASHVRSVNSEHDGSTSLVSFPAGSIAVNQKRLEGAPKTRRRTVPITKKEPFDTGSNRDISSEPDGSTSLVSFPTGSIAVIQKRLEGAPKTRRRVRATDISPPAIGAEGIHKEECIRPVNSKQNRTDTRRSGRVPDRRTSVDSDECSISLSPPSSDDESDKRKMVIQAPMEKSDVFVSQPTRRASTGAISRYGSVAEQRIDENHSNHHDESKYNEFIRQSKSVDFDLEVPSSSPMKFRKRLGIRRSMDLSGEAIEFYSKRSSIGNMSAHSGTLGEIDNDEVDYMKASAVVEALLRLADVGHFYQNWQNMTDWSSRMFRERTRNAPNPEKRREIADQWFDNQIRIIDSYLKPLALQLDEAGVFGEFNGAIFAQNVDEIRNHWMIYGFEWTERLLQSEGL
jgi:3'5'-cyclic nucleotide phosphodiesterase